MDAPILPRRLQRPINRLVREAQATIANAGTVPVSRQLTIWRHGFYGQNATLYDFDRYGFEPFISDLQRATRLEAVNDPKQKVILNDKLLTFLFLRAIGAPTPTVYAFANGKRLVFLEPGQTVEGLLATHGRLVVKPRGGSGGKRFTLLERQGETILANGQPRTDLGDLLTGSVIVSEYVEQHPVSKRIHPRTTNTLRVLMLRDADTGEPFVVKAVQRFGTSRSGAVDNAGQGGMAAEVFQDTGKLDRLAALPGINFTEPGPVRWYPRHPDTDEPVEGVVVPHWPEVIEGLKRVTETMEGLRCVGWDVAITPDGYSIIEGNNRPDVIMQVHGPFLAEPRARRAFAAYGVVSPDGA